MIKGFVAITYVFFRTRRSFRKRNVPLKCDVRTRPTDQDAERSRCDLPCFGLDVVVRERAAIKLNAYGLDDIGLTMEKAASIETFETQAAEARPWV